MLSVQSQLVSVSRSFSYGCAASAHEPRPRGQCGRAAVFVSLSLDEMAFRSEVVVDVGMRTEANFCSVVIRLNLSMARSRRRNDGWLFFTRLLPSGRSPASQHCRARSSQPCRTVDHRGVMATDDPRRFSAFFMRFRAGALSRVFVMQLSKFSPSWSTARHR